jgi:hypothetical protein
VAVNSAGEDVSKIKTKWDKVVEYLNDTQISSKSTTVDQGLYTKRKSQQAESLFGLPPQQLGLSGELYTL